MFFASGTAQYSQVQCSESNEGELSMHEVHPKQ